MKLKSAWLVLAALLLCGLNGFSQDTNFWIFLCFGQSNMEGFPGVQPEDKGPVDPRFQVLASVDFPNMNRKKGNWYPANPPLCRPGTGLCPADYFGRTMVSNLPPNIKGRHRQCCRRRLQSSELFEKTNFQAYASTAAPWMKTIITTYGGNPYQYLVDMRNRLAQKDGVIKGILVHQGESNPNDHRMLPNKVKGIYDDLVEDGRLSNLKAQDTPLPASASS